MSPQMPVQMTIPESGKSIEEITDEEFVMLDFAARRRQVTLHILKAELLAQSPSQPQGQEKKRKNKGDKAATVSRPNSSDIQVVERDVPRRDPTLDSYFPETSSKATNSEAGPMLQKSVADNNSPAPSLPTNTGRDRRRPAPLNFNSHLLPKTTVASPDASWGSGSLSPENGLPLCSPYRGPASPMSLNSSPLLSPTIRAFLDPATRSIQSPIELRQPSFTMSAEERSSPLADHPAFLLEGNINYPEHHYVKVNTILEEIANLNIMAEVPGNTSKKEIPEIFGKYIEAKNRNEQTAKRLLRQSSSSSKEVVPDISGMLASMRMIQAKGSGECPGVPGTKFLAELTTNPEEEKYCQYDSTQVLDISIRKQSWISGVQDCAPAALRDAEHRGYFAHLEHEHIVDERLPLTPNSCLSKNLEQSLAQLHAADRIPYNESEDGTSETASLQTIREPQDLVKLTSGDGQSPSDSNGKNRGSYMPHHREGPTDVGALVQMTEVYEKRKSVLMDLAGTLVTYPVSPICEYKSRGSVCTVSEDDEEKA